MLLIVLQVRVGLSVTPDERSVGCRAISVRRLVPLVGLQLYRMFSQTATSSSVTGELHWAPGRARIGFTLEFCSVLVPLT